MLGFKMVQRVWVKELTELPMLPSRMSLKAQKGSTINFILSNLKCDRQTVWHQAIAIQIKFYKFYRSSRNANVCVQTSDKLAKIFILVFQKVRGTNIKDMDTSADQGEGLFVTCDIKQGELISFYSGHMVHHSGPHSLHRRKISDSSKIYQQKYDVT